MPSEPLRFPIYSASILAFSFCLCITVSLPYIRIGTNNVSCKTVYTLQLQTFSINRDLTTPSTFLSFTTFQRHSASSVPDSYKAQAEYLNTNTYSSHIPSPQTSSSSPFNAITLLLFALAFRPLLLHTSVNRPTIAIGYFSYSPH